MEVATLDFDAIQSEQVAWSLKNFGLQQLHRPLLGIIEELCELEEADLNEDGPGVEDAIGDVAIYMLDYCGKAQWRMQELWDERAYPAWMEDIVPLEGLPYVSGFIKDLAHSQLKGEQGIRGGADKHAVKMKATFSAILWLLDEAAKLADKDFQTILSNVWAKVSKRDWTKNPDTAHEVAEAEVSS